MVGWYAVSVNAGAKSGRGCVCEDSSEFNFDDFLQQLQSTACSYNSSTSRTAPGSSRYPVTYNMVGLVEPQLAKHSFDRPYIAHFQLYTKYDNVQIVRKPCPYAVYIHWDLLKYNNEFKYVFSVLHTLTLHVSTCRWLVDPTRILLFSEVNIYCCRNNRSSEVTVFYTLLIWWNFHALWVKSPFV